MLEIVVGVICFLFAGGILGYIACLNSRENKRVEAMIKRLDQYQNQKETPQ